jgi:hypothetical protein
MCFYVLLMMLGAKSLQGHVVVVIFDLVLALQEQLH